MRKYKKNEKKWEKMRKNENKWEKMRKITKILNEWIIKIYCTNRIVYNYLSRNHLISH